MDVRDLLTEVADAPSPPPRIDLDLARRRGRLRRWLRRSFAPAAVALAAVAALIVPHSFSHTERAVPAAQGRATPAAPAEFGPFTPYASFGWLPAGFTASGTQVNSATSDRAGVSDWAVSAQLRRTLNLVVNARGSCAWSGSKASCADEEFQSMGTAPDVDGHRAVWTIDGIAWEYASGAWASVQAGKFVAQSAQTRTLLRKVAGGVRYGGTTPVVFAFRLDRALPANWSVTEASFTRTAGRLTATGLSAGPAYEPAALKLSVYPPAARTGLTGCDGVGQATVLALGGARWGFRKQVSEADKLVQTLCSVGTIDGLKVVISLDVKVGATWGTPESVLQALRLLGPDVSAWTANPVG